MSDGLHGNLHARYSEYPKQGFGRLRGQPRGDWRKIPRYLISEVEPLRRPIYRPLSPNRGYHHAWLGL
jgi:hypothetical protein